MAEPPVKIRIIKLYLALKFSTRLGHVEWPLPQNQEHEVKWARKKKKKIERQRSTLLFYSFIEKNGEPSHKRHLRNIILLEWPENMTQTRKLAGFFYRRSIF